MKTFISGIILAVALMFISPIVGLAAPVSTSNQLFSACDINNQTAKSSICPDRNTTTNPVNKKIKNAADIVAIITGAAAVVMIVISGFTFITAGGSVTGQRSSDPNRLKSARATLSAAIIGLVIIALAWTIISFVTDRLIK